MVPPWQVTGQGLVRHEAGWEDGVNLASDRLSGFGVCFEWQSRSHHVPSCDHRRRAARAVALRNARRCDGQRTNESRRKTRTGRFRVGVLLVHGSGFSTTQRRRCGHLRLQRRRCGEPLVRTDLHGNHGACRGRASQLRSGRDLVSRPARSLLEDPRPHHSKPAGGRLRIAVSLGDLLPRRNRAATRQTLPR